MSVDVSAAGLIGLKEAGVDDRIIQAMQARVGDQAPAGAPQDVYIATRDRVTGATAAHRLRVDAGTPLGREGEARSPPSLLPFYAG